MITGQPYLGFRPPSPMHRLLGQVSLSLFIIRHTEFVQRLASTRTLFIRDR